MVDLHHATRDELIRFILAQQDLLADQARRLAAMETHLTEAQATVGRLTEQLGALVAPDDDGPGRHAQRDARSEAEADPVAWTLPR
jgi:hypothetical protein